jgi:ComF family protein
MCARPLTGPRAIACAACKTSSSALRSVTACYEYGGQIAVALRRIKFSGRNDVARTLRPLLQSQFEKASAGCQIAVAVPLHPSRLRKRGFNQAQRILVPLAGARRLPIGRGALRRIRATPPQSRLSRRERAANLARAFRANETIAGKSVLLLDDIRTTGATLQAAAHALRRAGAREIHGFVVARTEWEG